MIRFEVESIPAEGPPVWVLCIEAPDMDGWADFRDAAGGTDHVRAVEASTGCVLREFIPGATS